MAAKITITIDDNISIKTAGSPEDWAEAWMTLKLGPSSVTHTDENIPGFLHTIAKLIKRKTRYV